ncbi:MAG: vitamin K epoxide reductase family protein [bacterium]
MNLLTGKVTLKSILWDFGMLLAVSGMVLTLYLTWVSINGSVGVICSANSGCEDVLTSAYSQFLGLPTSFYGFSYYLAFTLLLAVYPLISSSSRAYVLNVLLSLTVFAFFISAYLTVYSIETIGATCPYCLASFGIITALLLGLVFWWIRGGRTEEFEANQTAVWQGLAAFFFVATLVAGGFFFQFADTSTSTSSNVAGEKSVLASGPHSIGNPSAPVRVVEFFDLACPYCRRFTLNTFPKIRKNYIETGQVLWTFRAFPIPNHSNSPYAFSALHSVPDDQYVTMKKTIMKNQKQWKAKYTGDPKPYFKRLFQMSGHCFQCISTEIGDRLVEKRNLYSQVGVRGTPTFMVNGELVQPKGYSDWQKRLDQRLRQARQ